jgi:hypothetical protein
MTLISSFWLDDLVIDGLLSTYMIFPEYFFISGVARPFTND